MIFHFNWVFDCWIAWLFVREHYETTPPPPLLTKLTPTDRAVPLCMPAASTATAPTVLAQRNVDLTIVGVFFHRLWAWN
jgi:hypothetical protein